MCAIAPFVLHGLAGVTPRAAPGFAVRLPAKASYAEVVRSTWRGCGYGYDDAAVVRPPKPADLPMPSMELLALSRRPHGDHDADFMAMLRGIPSVRVPAAGLASVPTDARHDATPTTPVAVLAAPRSYGDDDAAEGDEVTIKTPPKKQMQQQCGGEYDADIDATFRVMETDPAERPSADYLSGTQAGGMMMTDRAEVVKRMHLFSRYYELAPGTLHRAVSYVDRFLSAKKINGGDRRKLRLLGTTAVFAAAKYEDRNTLRRVDADDVALYARYTRRQVLDAERELVAALGYRLSGPTAYTFVDHFMRHDQEEEEGAPAAAAAAVRLLAHHLADMALLDYRCVAFLPSAVAASAIVLARLAVLGYSAAPPAGYALDDLMECMEAIYGLHENLSVWPGCEQMMADWELTAQFRYSLPPPFTLIAN